MTGDPQTFAIIGAAMEVHRELGCGFLESVYHEALGEEFSRRNIPYDREVGLRVTYKDKMLSCLFKADFLCFGSVIVELKALDSLTGKDQAQLINYLKATKITRGLLINFGAASLQYERLVLGFKEV